MSKEGAEEGRGKVKGNRPLSKWAQIKHTVLCALLVRISTQHIYLFRRISRKTVKRYTEMNLSHQRNKRGHTHTHTVHDR